MDYKGSSEDTLEDQCFAFRQNLYYNIIQQQRLQLARRS